MKKNIRLLAAAFIIPVIFATGCKSDKGENKTSEKATEQQPEAQINIDPNAQMGSSDDLVIVIDAGHGENDPGSIGVNGVYEKDCNLAIAKAMRDELSQYSGVKVYLTRSDDYWMTNTGRAMIAAALDADFLVSVHNNSGSETNSGCIAYRTMNELYSEITNDICSLVTENLAAIGLNNGGVQVRESTEFAGEDYYTLIGEGVRCGIPSIIIEHCFLSNESDCNFISNPDGSVKEDTILAMAKADAQAFVTHYGLSKRTSIADSASYVTLERGYKTAVTIPSFSGGNVSWYSIDQSVANVDEQGVVTAIGRGTTNIVYKLDDGTTGYCVVNVKGENEIALVGGIDPTFYDSTEAFRQADMSSVFAFVLYSDGSSIKVKPDTVGNVDFEKTGMQDVDIAYGNLPGKLRICNKSGYVPEVTKPDREEKPTNGPTQDTAIENTSAEGSTNELEGATDSQNMTDPVIEASTAVENKEAGTDATNDSEATVKSLIKYVIILIIVIVVGVILLILENNKRRRRRYSRRR